MRSRLKFEAIRTAMAIGISFLILLVIIFFISKNPLDAIYYLFLGPLESISSFSSVLVLMIPLMLTGTSLCIIFSADSLNLASESAVYIGGIAVTAVALAFPNLPGIILFPLVLAAAVLAGSISTGIPAYLKLKTNSDEMVVSLMLNYILYFFGLYMLNYHLKDYNYSGLASFKLPTQILIPTIPNTRIHLGIVISVLVVFASYILMYKTKWGLQVRVTGANKKFAKFIGINVPVTAVSAQLTGGAIAGLAGAVELLGLYRRFSWLYPLEYGWDGIILATLSRNNPLFIPLSAFFISYLRIGSDIMARKSDVPREALKIVQGIIIILIIAEKLTARFEKQALFKKAKSDLSEGVDKP